VRPYRGIEVATHPLPSCGIVGLAILAILERLPPPSRATFGPHGWRDAAWPHLGIEASKLALAMRDAQLGDPDALAISERDILDPSAIDDLVAGVDPDRAAIGAPMATLVGGTAYVAAVDETGQAASLITSNASGFGSGVVDPTTGIAFHDRGQGFSLDPEHPNALAPGKRPLHSLLPGMLLRDGRPWILVGSMGGDAQPSILAQVVSAIVDGGADVGAAVSVARWETVPQKDPAAPVGLSVDVGLDPAVAAGLEARGHAVRIAPLDQEVGHCHAIEIRSAPDHAGDRLVAATDPRSNGLPAVD
jgi:gamma-glutamyltranspeptidase/glutathione hydrolase